jgi:hypothetical protein
MPQVAVIPWKDDENKYYPENKNCCVSMAKAKSFISDSCKKICYQQNLYNAYTLYL